MQTICIAICEDDGSDASELCRLIGLSGISADVHIFDTIEAFFSVWKPGAFQLIFLDVYFNSPAAGNRADGIEAAQRIRGTDDRVWIAFTTSSPDYATFGYKVRADRYILKPPDEQEVLSLLDRAFAHFQQQSDEITVTVGRKPRGVRLRDIRYVEASNKQSILHMTDETVTTYSTIDELEKQLILPSFIRCHRSYIVNMEHVESADRDFTMRGGGVAYISHTNQWKVRKTYRDYLIRLARCCN